MQFLFAVLSNQQIQVKNYAPIECYFTAMANEFVCFNQLAQAGAIKIIRTLQLAF